jgi:hypothetical protein
MIEIEIDCRAFERWAEELHAAIDQVPYALALAMNQMPGLVHQGSCAIPRIKQAYGPPGTIASKITAGAGEAACIFQTPS